MTEEASPGAVPAEPEKVGVVVVVPGSSGVRTGAMSSTVMVLLAAETQTPLSPMRWTVMV